MSKLVLSLIIPTKSEEDSGYLQLLHSIKQQDFRKDMMEIIPAMQGDSEEARGHAILQAKGDIIGFLCTDNLLRDSSFLRTMVWHASLPDVVGAYTFHYDHVWSDKPLSRYFALLGANDPVCWWLRKVDRKSYLNSPVSGLITLPKRMPSVGDNGFFIKRNILLKANIQPATHFVIDVVQDLWNLGYRDYYIVANKRLWHKTGESWKTYFVKRWNYADRLYFQRFKERRWRMVETPYDWFMVFFFTLCSFFVIPHLIYAILGYSRRRDWAWFLHPLVCLAITVLYGILLVKNLLHLSLYRRLEEMKSSLSV